MQRISKISVHRFVLINFYVISYVLFLLALFSDMRILATKFGFVVVSNYMGIDRAITQRNCNDHYFTSYPSVILHVHWCG